MYDSHTIIRFEIVTPEKVALKDDVLQITVPTQEGEITILPKHTPLVANLKPGVVELKNKDNQIKIISVSGGFIEVLRNKVVLLADTAERAEEIDIKRAEEARERAEKSLKELRHFDTERFVNLNAQMEKELARTRSVKKWRKLLT
ncbi:ATP synthase F1 subunit epsilon [Patescibacteria group bacterium]|nr:ATP synthase F1 subunit epsilon [Patescibacteria group bacterium]MBU1684376.1 ATP synthase F1 subunit epsilon [Patescibacteria group bacterium]